MFSCPSQIQPFRAQADRITEYRWSLYIKRMDLPGNHEEFVENIAVDLRKEWQFFQ
jgi:hypothetical protein